MKKLLLLLVLIIPTMTFALQEALELPAPDALILALTPFIILGATALVKMLRKTINGATTLIIVTILSGVVPWVTDLLLNIEGSWLTQFGFGLVSVFIHQFYTQFKKTD